MRDDRKQKQGPEPVQRLSLWDEQEQQGKEQLPQPWDALLAEQLQAQQWLRPHAALLRNWFMLLGNSYQEVLLGQRRNGKKRHWSLFTLGRPVSDEEPACFPHWPAAGLYDAEAGVGIAVDVPEHPHRIRGSLLIDVIEKGPVSERYFLSPRAARGMLRRTDRMKRKLFPPLRQSLEILARSDQGEGNHDVWLYDKKSKGVDQ